MAKKTLLVDIQYQVKIVDEQSKDSKTYEYSHQGYLKADKVTVDDPYEKEIAVLSFLVKEFKRHARDQKKALEKQAKRARKAGKS